MSRLNLRMGAFVRVCVCFCAFAVAWSGGAAHAQRFGGISSGLVNLGDVLLPNTTQLTLGIGPNYLPDYIGSDDYDFGVDGNIFIRFNNYATVSNEGADFNILGLSDFELGPSIDLVGGRNDDRNPALEGLGDIGRSLEIGVYGKARIRDVYTARVQYRCGLTGHDGDTIVVRLNRLLYRSANERLSVAGGVRWFWGDKDYIRAFFGVDEEQSAASGLAVTEPDGSTRDLRLSFAAQWRVRDRWAFNAYTGYSALVGNAASAQIVNDFGTRHQFGVGANLTYTFDLELPHR
ncbi:MAG: MipA/OmpV family protein [Pseudomonadota bacterium]